MIKKDVTLAKAKDTYEYDFLVFIGRFQPFHKGHEFVIKTALAKARHVVVLIGSAKTARNPKNPFTWQERSRMIHGSFKDERHRLHITPVLDMPYAEHEWVNNVKLSAQGIICQYQSSQDIKVGLIGHSKDESSYYLNMFPGWLSVDVSKTIDIDATEIREPYLELGIIHHAEHLPATTIGFLQDFRSGEIYRCLSEEFKDNQAYKRLWDQTPFPPTFMTVDALVEHGEKILMIRRKNSPGKGLWALPGGFLDTEETLKQSAIRELKEETNILVSENDLGSAIVEQKIFDSPTRSARGRTLTSVFRFDISDQDLDEPIINAGDDAAEAEWISKEDLNPEKMFEDHFFIIQAMLNRHQGEGRRYA